MGGLNALPGFGWLLSLFLSASAAVPFWFLWTSCGLGFRYFGRWLPEEYWSIPFLHLVGLFMIWTILLSGFPKLASVNQTSRIDKLR